MCILKNAVVIFLPVIIIIAAILSYIFYVNVKADRTVIEKGEPRVIDLQIEAISRNFKSIVSDVMILAKQGELEKMMNENEEEEEKEELAIEFLEFSIRKKSYDQIRYLNEIGMEVVRINFNEGYPSIVPKDRLQNKGKRYYFTDAFVLNKDEVFVSPLDLNIEKGKIERPVTIDTDNEYFNSIWQLCKDSKYVKPMIRFGTPIVDAVGNKKGIVLVNYFGTQLLNLFDEIAKNSLGQCFLINKDGYWLRGRNDRHEEWGFMQEHDDIKVPTFEKAFPYASHEIFSEKEGQFYAKEGLFTFKTMYPLREGLKSSTGSGEAFALSMERLDAKEYYWKIVSFIPREVLSQRMRNLSFGFHLLFVIFFTISAIGSWIFAGINTKRKQAEAEVRQYNTRIKDELAFAKQIQLSIIPMQFPDGKKFDAKGVYQAMDEVGGDYYDVFDISPDKTGFVIVDVSGHGPSAALITTMVKVAFYSHSHESNSAEDVVNAVNNDMFPIIGKLREYFTAFYGIVDTKNNVIDYVCAGHIPPILYRAKSKKVTRLESRGTFVGILDNYTFEQKRVALEKGDKIILFTDGITETMNAEKEMFTDSRLEDYIIKNNGVSPQDIVDGIIEELNVFSEGQPADDDRAILCIEMQ